MTVADSDDHPVLTVIVLTRRVHIQFINVQFVWSKSDPRVSRTLVTPYSWFDGGGYQFRSMVKYIARVVRFTV